MNKKKKINKRSREKYPNLRPELQLKTRFDLYDQDYTHKLNDEEKAFLNKFNSEWANASLDTENLENNLHNTKELKKDCQDRNNARNRCILTRERATGFIKYLEDLTNEVGYDEYEDILIGAIDLGEQFNDDGDSSSD